MTLVNTVRGPVEVADLGRTLMHEHLVFGYPGHDGDRTMWSISEETLIANACRAVEAAKAQGFGTLFEVTPNDCGRSPELLRRIAEATDTNIICATGYYYEGEGAPAYFGFRSLFADVVAEVSDLMVTELTEGIAGTGIRAGVIKLGTSEGRITDYEHNMIKAAARAQQATGAPIVTHTQSGTMGPDQARRLVEAGADPSKVVIGHMCGNAKDLDYQLATLAHGVGIGFDRIGLNNMFNDITDDDRMDTITVLVDRGYGNRIFLSQDSVNNWLGRDVQGFYDLPATEHWKISRIGEYILPGLRRRGLGDADLDGLVIGNIARLWNQG
jgi:phosphotriesterase-related protein